MHTGLIIATLATGLLGLYLLAGRKNIKQNAVKLLTGNLRQPLSGQMPADETWWALLDTPLQFELAMALARKALPVWQKYSGSNELFYKNSSIGPSLAIKTTLLQASLDALEEAVSIPFPRNNKNISTCYNDFVAPLVALQDGNWVVSYPVKKIFLAVYNLVKAVAEEENITVTKNLFCVSIHQSLDCLDLSKLYSAEEIMLFLQYYKLQPAT